MKKMIAAFASAAMLAVLVSGCQNTVNTMENTEKTMVPQSVSTKYVSTDSFCRDRLEIVSINKAEVPGGLMKVEIMLRSKRYGFWSEFWSWFTGENPYPIEYKFDWFDANGMSVQTATSVWQQMNIMPGESKPISSVSPNAKCKDFMLGLKEYGK